jgi:small subunit ribosomal protein S20
MVLHGACRRFAIGYKSRSRFVEWKANMPHTESAKKSLRQNEKRRLRNKATRKGIKLALRPLSPPAKDAKPEELKKDALQAIRLLDKAASKRRIHPNKAARKKSQIARALNKAGAK